MLIAGNALAKVIKEYAAGWSIAEEKLEKINNTLILLLEELGANEGEPVGKANIYCSLLIIKIMKTHSEEGVVSWKKRAGEWWSILQSITDFTPCQLYYVWLLTSVLVSQQFTSLASVGNDSLKEYSAWTDKFIEYFIQIYSKTLEEKEYIYADCILLVKELQAFAFIPADKASPEQVAHALHKII